MEYQKIEMKHTKEIMQKYSVNSLVAKVIEAKKMQRSQFVKLVQTPFIFHEFSLFEESQKVIDRLESAIVNKEKVCIYGDYDCDGILATTIYVEALKMRGLKAGYHIPNRFTDGYGLNEKRVQQIYDKGYTLIITADNGIKCHKAIKLANSLGIDVIITDHHHFEEDEELPEAFAIIHPGVSQSYPFRDICAGMIAFKLSTALLRKKDAYLFCLAAITTISDMMPLIDENRFLVKKALEIMNEKHYPSLELLKTSQNYDVQTLGFQIAPKINAFGRLPEIVSPTQLVKYFAKRASFDFQMTISEKAKEINKERQKLTTYFYEKALKSEHDHYLCFASDDVHEGIVGLIAGKYTRNYEKPAFVMNYNQEEELYKGSCRSVEDYPIDVFFQKYKNLFEAYGGHALAGGFSIKKDNFETFESLLKEELQNFESHQKKDVISLDEHDLDLESVNSLNVFEPFGMGFERPLYLLENPQVLEVILLNGNHLKFKVKIKSFVFDCLYFFKGKQKELFESQDHLNFVGQLSINEFRQQRSVQFLIEDVYF